MQWNRPGGNSHAKRAAELARELSEARECAERLRAERDEQADLAQRSAQHAVTARESREDVRRVLAAARATEQRAEKEVQNVRAEVARLTEQVALVERNRGEVDGRVRQLESRLAEERKTAERLLREATDRAWALSAEHGENMQTVIIERETAQAHVRALSVQMPAVRRVANARAVLAVALVCAVLAGLLLPGLAGMASGDERARVLDGFTALSAETPILLFAGFTSLALGLLVWGLYLLRGTSAKRSARVLAGVAARARS